MEAPPPVEAGAGSIPPGDGAASSSLRPASPGYVGDTWVPAASAIGGNGGSSVPPSPSNAAAAQRAGTAETAASTAAAASSSSSLLRRPQSAGRLFTSDPSLSTLPLRRQQQQQPAAPSHHAAWGGPAGGALSAGATPTAASSASAAALAVAAPFCGGAALGGAGRSWLKVDAEGRATVVRVDKSSLAAELGVQARDLRLLDPHFNHSYPSAILCRDRVSTKFFFFLPIVDYFFLNVLTLLPLFPPLSFSKKKQSTPGPRRQPRVHQAHRDANAGARAQRCRRRCARVC